MDDGRVPPPSPGPIPLQDRPIALDGRLDPLPLEDALPDASASDANGRLLDNGFFYVFDGVTDVLETSPRSWLALPDEAGAHR